MTTTATPTSTSTSQPTPTTSKGSLRVAGWGGLGFAALVVTENVLRSKNPQAGATVGDVISYYRDQRVPAAIGDALFVLTIPCLLLFAEGLRRSVGDRLPARA